MCRDNKSHGFRYLKKTSLYDLAVGCGIGNPSEFVERFIAYEREQKKAGKPDKREEEEMRADG